MPPKEKGLSELYVLQPDGKKVIIGKIEQAEIISDDVCDIYDLQTITHPMNTAVFQVTWKPTADVIHLLIYGRLPTNNWRRMHGFPLKRKR